MTDEAWAEDHPLMRYLTNEERQFFAGDTAALIRSLAEARRAVEMVIIGSRVELDESQTGIVFVSEADRWCRFVTLGMVASTQCPESGCPGASPRYRTNGDGAKGSYPDCSRFHPGDHLREGRFHPGRVVACGAVQDRLEADALLKRVKEEQG